MKLFVCVFLLFMFNPVKANDVVHATSEDIAEFDSLFGETPQPSQGDSKKFKKSPPAGEKNNPREKFNMGNDPGPRANNSPRRKGPPRDDRERLRRRPPPPPGSKPPPNGEMPPPPPPN